MGANGDLSSVRPPLSRHWDIPEIAVPVEVSRAGGPQGRLRFVRPAERGATQSKWYVDEAGEEWFVKRDFYVNGLQSSASVISAQVYRHFGWIVPDTFSFRMGSDWFSVSRRLKKYEYQDGNFLMPQLVRQQLAAITYLLDDADRTTPGNSQWDEETATLSLIDFDATLGADAWGYAKPGNQVSLRVGALSATGGLPSSLDRDAVISILDPLHRLTNSLIEEYVQAARYPTERETQAVVDFLRHRRDALIQFAVAPQ